MQNSQNRQDLQGIRGIAIISVLSFHFLPSVFPNGYIGVDQFFVLSGFLMCMLLRKSSSSSIFQFVSNFYIRRLKRILPLYFLIILLAITAVLTIFPLTAIDTNVESGKKALVFMSNRAETDSENYFKRLSMAIDVFTHTWSLSVEVQFYLIVPFLYIIGAKVFRSEFETHFYIFLGSISYIYSIFFLSPIVAFNSVPARIWQFTVRMIAYMISDSSKTTHSNKVYQKIEILDEEEENSPQEVSYIPSSTSYHGHFLTSIIIFGSFFPFEIPPDILRPLLTVLTGILMVYPSSFLESKFLVYSGDISYSLYLIHWPIYAYWKLNNQEVKTWNSELIIAFQVSVLLAILSYECYEKWYQKQQNKHILIICVVLFSINIGVFYKNEIQNLISPTPKLTARLDGLKAGQIISFEQAKQLNKDWSVHDLGNLRVPSCDYEHKGSTWGSCRHKNTTGKFKIMLIGNSWAANHGTLVYEECAHQASNLTQFAISGCEPLYWLSTQHKECKNAMTTFHGKVEKEKPDYLFVFSRFINIGDPIPSNITKIEDDPIYKTMKAQAEKLSKLVKNKIFLMQQLPRLIIKKLPGMVEAVKGQKDLAEFDKSLIDIDPKMARLRYEKLSSECPKCELFDYEPYFFNKTTKTWRFYDEKMNGLTYMTQGLHLSFHGLELIRPVIKSVCGKMNDR